MNRRVALIDRREMLAGTGAALLLVSDPTHAQSRNLDPVVLALAALIEREYPDAKIASKTARLLRHNLRRGRYRALQPAVLAEQLTADIRGTAQDQHLVVRHDPEDAKLRSPADQPVVAEPSKPRKNPSPRAQAIFGPQGYGVVKAELLKGNIGLLRIDNFVPLYDLVKARIGGAIGLLSDSWALILDLRNNGGGTTDTPAYLASYFFDRPPFVLNRMVWRYLPEEKIETTRQLVGPSYGETRPLIILTSRETFSAAEAVAYSLQSTGRAVIVGARTRGGANPGDFFNLGGGFVAFTPQGRAVDTVTGSNWEGSGVRPDIAVSSPDALRAGHRIAVERAIAQTRDPDTLAILREALKSGPEA